jgi:hypothetical protein
MPRLFYKENTSRWKPTKHFQGWGEVQFTISNCTYMSKVAGRMMFLVCSNFIAQYVIISYHRFLQAQGYKNSWVSVE